MLKALEPRSAHPWHVFFLKIYIFPAVIPPICGDSGPEKPKLDWYQTTATLTLSIYTRRKHCLQPEHVIVEYNSERKLIHVLVLLMEDSTGYNLAYE
jgi:hypothetical protein